jgi:glycosyltransferase involved in cell wall biosynthesis
LVIVGEAEALRKDVEDDLHKLVAELKIEERVVFAGNQQKVAECLSIADVVVSSNVRKPEAFGRSMAEALAMGKPVIAKAFGGALDIVRDGVDGVLVKECEFAEAIVKVAQMQFGDLRKDALERFSFDLMIDRSLAVYRELGGK